MKHSITKFTLLCYFLLFYSALVHSQKIYFIQQKIEIDINKDGIKDIITIEKEGTDSNSQDKEFIESGIYFLVCKISNKKTGGYNTFKSKNIGDNMYNVWKLEKSKNSFNLGLYDLGAGYRSIKYGFGYDEISNTVRIKWIEKSQGGGGIEEIFNYEIATGKWNSYSSYLDEKLKKKTSTENGIEKGMLIYKNTIDLRDFSQSFIDNNIDNIFDTEKWKNISSVKELENIYDTINESEKEDFYKKYLKVTIYEKLQQNLSDKNYSPMVLEALVQSILDHNSNCSSESYLQSSDETKKSYIKMLDNKIFNEGNIPNSEFFFDSYCLLNLIYYSKEDDSGAFCGDSNFDIEELVPKKILRVTYHNLGTAVFSLYFRIEGDSLYQSEDYIELLNIPKVSSVMKGQEKLNLIQYTRSGLEIDKINKDNSYLLSVPYWTNEDTPCCPSITYIYSTKDFKSYKLKKIEF